MKVRFKDLHSLFSLSKSPLLTMLCQAPSSQPGAGTVARAARPLSPAQARRGVTQAHRRVIEDNALGGPAPSARAHARWSITAVWPASASEATLFQKFSFGEGCGSFLVRDSRHRRHEKRPSSRGGLFGGGTRRCLGRHQERPSTCGGLFGGGTQRYLGRHEKQPSSRCGLFGGSTQRCLFGGSTQRCLGYAEYCSKADHGILIREGAS